MMPASSTEATLWDEVSSAPDRELWILHPAGEPMPRRRRIARIPVGDAP